MLGTGLLAGKTAFVTGGASGIGRAIVECFAASGARGFAFDPDARGTLPQGWVFASGDVTVEGEIEDALARLARELGQLDVVVANAGIVPPWRDTESPDLAEWDRTFAVNVRGVMATVSQAVRHMTERGGSIIAIASVNATDAHPKQAAYTASKHAVLGIVRATARDVGRHGVRVNALCPGPIATAALIQRIDARGASGGPQREAALRAYAETPLGRMASAAEVAGAALFLASDLSSGITGQAIAVDAGLTA